jgi:hypothetical protein
MTAPKSEKGRAQEPMPRICHGLRRNLQHPIPWVEKYPALPACSLRRWSVTPTPSPTSRSSPTTATCPAAHPHPLCNRHFLSVTAVRRRATAQVASLLSLLPETGKTTSILALGLSGRARVVLQRQIWLLKALGLRA